MEKLHWIKLLTFQYSPSDVMDYFRGNIRYKFYYNAALTKYLPVHIVEQINFRILMMDHECYLRGSCKICGCKTTNLQMANKSCEGNCYPSMMNKVQWRKFKYMGSFISGEYFWYNRVYIKNFTEHHVKFIVKKHFSELEDVE